MAKKKKRKKRKALSYIGIFFGVLLGVILAAGIVAAAGYLILESRGRSRLQEKQEALPLAMVSGNDVLEEAQESENALQEGEIRYQGEVYAYKKDILTFLFLGIDKKGEMAEAENRIKGGQADAIFLLVLDPSEASIEIIGVNRDTMADIDVYDEDGAFIETKKAQIALQHAYGDGLEQSCERTVKAVSNLFYGLPIHGYCSVNMEVIILLNDALGGVDVTPSEDIYINKQLKWKAGESVHLEGKDAFDFVQNRDTAVAQSAEGRLARQKQYLQAFIEKAKEQMKQDMTLPLTLYTELSPYMVTDVTADEVVYLAARALSWQFDPSHIYTLEGEVVQGETYEEFYQDDTALYELILDVFYEKKETE